MNYIIKISDDIKIYNNKQWSFDLSKNEGFKLFHEVQESIQSYRHSYEILQKRGIALQVERPLESFINYSYSEKEIDFITEIIERNNDRLSKVEKTEQGSFDLLKKLDPTGIELLNIPTDINLQILKKLYRRTALKYHPDMGGSHNTMVKVNKSYTLFHNALLNFIPNRESPAEKIYKIQSQPVSWLDFQFSVYLVLACINGDFFAADRAFSHLKKAYTYASQNSSTFIGQLVFDLSDMGNVVVSTCGVLGRFNMREELREASRITSYLFDRVIEFWAEFDDPLYRPEREDYPSEEELNDQLGTRLVLNHPEKVKNAFRLGKIDEKRFTQTMSKFKTESSYEEEEIKKINEFIAQTGFIPKLSNADYKIKVTNPHVVNPPNFNQTRFNHLNENQKWEYLKAFSHEGNGHLIKKYYHIRTQEILLGLIHNYSSLNMELLKEEINFFCKFFPDKFKEYLFILEFLNHVQSLGDNQRIVKLRLLNELDEINLESNATSFSISLSDPLKSIPKKQISVNYYYIEFAKMPIDKIERYRDTGDFFDDYHVAVNRDRIALDNLNNSKIGKNRTDVWLRPGGATPEEVIESCEPYIEALLELGQTFHPKNTGELQIGYEINRLTLAYGKLKKWAEVIYWCKLFFNLPRYYRDRSSIGELDSIKRRLERAEKLIENSGKKTA